MANDHYNRLSWPDSNPMFSQLLKEHIFIFYWMYIVINASLTVKLQAFVVSSNFVGIQSNHP